MELYWESDLTKNSVERYMRQVIVPNIGIDGQKYIENSSILIVGLGGLGSPVAGYIAMSGVGMIGIVDFDSVELHNLQRQLAHSELYVGKKKTESMANFIQGLNSNVRVKIHDVILDSINAKEIISKYDLVIDCCDRIETRYIISDACQILGKDLICGSVLRWGGQICVIPKEGRCFRCIFPEMKTSGKNCDESGVVGPMCGVIGSMQATEALKMIVERNTGVNIYRVTKMIIYNGFANTYNCFRLNCSLCIKCREIDVNKKKVDIIENSKFGTDNEKLLNSCNHKSITGCELEKKSLSNQPINHDKIFKWKDILKNIDQFVIYDIRSEIHYRLFRVKGSINRSSFKDILELPGKTIIVMCYHGISSLKFVEELRKKGIIAFSAEDGIDGFKKEINML